MQNNWEKELGRALKESVGEPDAERMAMTAEALHKAYRGKHRERIGFTGFLLRQIRFNGWKIWLMQGVLLGLLRLVLTFTYGSLKVVNQEKIPLLLCCISVLIVMTAVPFLWRSLRYRMFETEIATRMSMGRLTGAWLVLAGLGDAAVLSCVFWYTVRSTAISRSGAVLYLLVPFLLAAAGLCYLLGHVRPERFCAGCAGNVRCASSSFSGCRRVLPGGVPAELQPWLGRYLSLPAGLWGTAMPFYPKKVCAVTVQAGLCIHWHRP